VDRRKAEAEEVVAETVRTFIAIELPGDVRQYVAECEDRLRRAGADVRWVRPDRIHLTLLFLGEVPADRLADLEAAVRSAAGSFGPLTLQAAGAGRFPPRGAPRIIWIGIEEPTGGLVRLQKAVADAAADFAEKREDRAFAAHLTLGRVRSGRGARELSTVLDKMAAEVGPTFEAREVVIFKSELSPQGPTYTPLAKLPLAGLRLS
jgi:2'-5' RNA ligase